jgi:hypothetical protein
MLAIPGKGSEVVVDFGVCVGPEVLVGGGLTLVELGYGAIGSELGFDEAVGRGSGVYGDDQIAFSVGPDLAEYALAGLVVEDETVDIALFLDNGLPSLLVVSPWLSRVVYAECDADVRRSQRVPARTSHHRYAVLVDEYRDARLEDGVKRVLAWARPGLQPA